MKAEEIYRVRNSYTVAKPRADNITYTVWIKIGNQSFCLDGYQETKENAEWMRTMLGKALLTVIEHDRRRRTKRLGGDRDVPGQGNEG